MTEWSQLLQRPENIADPAVADAWFSRIAHQLLNGCDLMAGGELHQLAEVEFYYFGEGHPDAFTHRDPVQLECGRWYFHRTRGTYRGGSFKGLDVTFGDGHNYGGVLLRSLVRADGTLIEGPSLLVDHLLAKTGYRTVAALDEDIARRPFWDGSNHLMLLSAASGRNLPIFRSGRVGLSLKKVTAASEGPRYIMRPYRFLTEQRRISKGKVYLVLALHAQGRSAADIRSLTGCPPATVQRYIDDFEAGRREADFAPFFGIDLGPKELCRLAGVWQAAFGTSS